jgi:hypothetical protein
MPVLIDRIDSAGDAVDILSRITFYFPINRSVRSMALSCCRDLTSFGGVEAIARIHVQWLLAVDFIACGLARSSRQPLSVVL